MLEIYRTRREKGGIEQKTDRYTIGNSTQSGLQHAKRDIWTFA